MLLGKNGEGSSTDILDLIPVPHLVLPKEVEHLKLKVKNIKITMFNKLTFIL